MRIYYLVAGFLVLRRSAPYVPWRDGAETALENRNSPPFLSSFFLVAETFVVVFVRSVQSGKDKKSLQAERSGKDFEPPFLSGPKARISYSLF